MSTTSGPEVMTKDPGAAPFSSTIVDSGPGPAEAAPEEATGRGYSNDTEALLKRLRRIEGQIRGLQRLVSADAYCIDILTQISAATRALEAVALQLLDKHLRHCVTDAAAAGQPDVHVKITEATEAIRRLVRS